MSPLRLAGILQLKVTLVLVEVEVKFCGAVGTIKTMKSTQYQQLFLLSCAVIKKHIVGGP